MDGIIVVPSRPTSELELINAGGHVSSSQSLHSQHQSSQKHETAVARKGVDTQRGRSSPRTVSALQPTGIHEQLPALLAEMQSLASDGDLEGAIRLGVTVLKKLGEAIPLRPTSVFVMREMPRSSRHLRKTSATGFLNQPYLRDASKHAALKVLSSIVLYSSQLNAKQGKNINAVAMLRMTTITCLYGLSEYTPVALAGFACFETAMGHFESANETGRLATDIAENIEGVSAAIGRFETLLYGQVVPWTGTTLDKIQPQIMGIYNKAMAAEDLDYAFFGVHYDICSRLFRGSERLSLLVPEFERYLIEMEELHVRSLSKWFVAAASTFTTALLGDEHQTAESEEPHPLIVALQQELVDQHGNDQVLVADYSYQILVKTVLRTFDPTTVPKDERMINTLAGAIRTDNNHFTTIFHYFALGMGYAGLLGATGKAKYAKAGRKVCRLLKAWHEKGVTIATGPYKLLAAEILMHNATDVEGPKQSRRYRLAAMMYEAAVTESRGAASCRMIEGLGNERLASIYEQLEGQSETVEKHSEQALMAYKQWGALRKVGLLNAPDSNGAVLEGTLGIEL